jgi:cysteine desulfurase
MLRIYLDNASTTRIDPRVYDSMKPYLTEIFGNPSSVHSFGQAARNAVDSSRRQLASLLNCLPNELVFTSGGTESNNLAIRGLAARFPNGHIITTAIEHSAVREVVKELGVHGIEITEIHPDAEGFVNPREVESAIQKNTFLVTVMLANNELGTIQPIREIATAVAAFRDAGQEIYLHSDAVQALGKIPVDAMELRCDLMSFSAHKLYAPKGIGALFVRKGVRLIPQVKGGPHEKGLRPGTENVAGIVAFGEACRICSREVTSDFDETSELRKHFEEMVLERIPGVRINGGDKRLPGISNLSFNALSGEALLILLDQKGIAVSTGSACASGTIEASHVLLALGKSTEEAKSALRFSFGRFNNEAEVEQTVEALVVAVGELRRND